MGKDSTQAWNEVGERFGQWSRVLSDHYRRRGEQLGAAPEEDRRKLEEALRAATRQLDQAFTALGDTIRDPGAKDSLKGAARAFGDALSATFSEVGQQIRRFGS